MPAQLISGSTKIMPTTLSEYSSDQDGGTIMHPILGRAAADVTLRPASLRTGSFVLDFRTEAASESARAALATAVVWTLSHTEQTTLNMRCIVRGVTREVAGNGRWPVSVRFEEVA
ncbi:hypothetical protein QE392_001396 [Microbacterium proteolyticum]|uniref:hypothetical protein n=1 Tax=Microbacterium proteolyticum TaxID=1572644 RepID=UPI0027839B65|nr:hypothetical protein [Microbacterium proteolyticum]MDQ1169592.1 hypothetical protein [Microbacterium proteolyticum]